MPTTITINGVSGATPFDIYLCDDLKLLMIIIVK